MFGIIILFATCFFLPSSDTWPGWRALLPVVAVSLVLAMQCGTNMALANPISQWIGLRSYSIYLWHWPFVVGLGIYGLHDNWKAIGAAIGATLIIGSMSFRHIETPSRKKLSLFQAKTSWLIFAGALAVVAAPASWLKESSSLPLRSKAALTEARLADEPAFAPNWRPECFDGSQKNGCIYGNEPVGALMVGDSHASVTVTSLLRLMSKTYRGIRFWGKGACMTVLEVASGDNIEGRQCKEFNTQTFNRLKAAPAGLPIVIVNRASLYPFGLYPVETHLPGRPQARLPDILPENKDAYLADYRRRLIATACAYAETGHPVFYMLPIPEFNVNISNELARNLIRGNTPADISIPLDDYLARNNFVISALEEARAQCGIHLLDPTRYLCREGRCFGSQDGLPLFSDNNHINERGRRLISPMFNAVLVSAGMHQ